MNIIECKINEDKLNYCERLYLEYACKKDIITSMFELHKFDNDASVLESIPFKHYEDEFAKAKIAYDIMMKDINDTIVPEEYKKESNRFEIDFQDKCVKVYVNE